MTFFLILACLFFITVTIILGRRQIALKREAVIRSFVFPTGLFEKLQKKHPHLTLKESQLVTRALRQYFLTHLKSGKKFVAMPSQAVDDLWHEFILYTRQYHAFCQAAFGQFFHHTPAAVLTGGKQQSNAGLRRCWIFACREENIHPQKANRLPLLFAIDSKLNIVNGFHYVADCASIRNTNDSNATTAIYCGGEFSGSSVDGESSSFFDGVSDFGGDGCGGDSGCGGGGCGGD
jgi:hypothetical protein